MSASVPGRRPSRKPARRLSGVELTVAARDAVAAVRPWIEGSDATRPTRTDLAAAVRLSAQLIAQDAPGHTVELRIPPFAAVQCVAGPGHRRGTPPNVVECTPLAWLRAATGVASILDMAKENQQETRVQMSGTRAADVAEFLPLFGTR